MTPRPRVHTSPHRIKFSDLDPYNHLRTAAYSAYFVDHRMDALREQAGWDLNGLAALPFMAWVKRMEIDFIRPVLGDQLVTIASSVTTFTGADARIECTMNDGSAKVLSRCVMIITCVDKQTLRPRDWPTESIALFVE